MQASLAKYQVLDLTTGGFRLSGRILADMGAEVIRIVAPGYTPDAANRYMDDGLSLVMLDYSEPNGRSMLLDLALGADIFIESCPPGLLDTYGLGYRPLSAENPGLVYAALSPFGQDDSYRSTAASDISVQAMSGWLSITGESDKPLKLPGEQSYQTAALFAVNGCLLALRRRRVTGKGSYMDISSRECAAATLDQVLVRYATNREVAQRQGSLHWNGMFRVFSCRDGEILLSIHRQWDTLVEWMASEVMSADLEDERYRDEQYRNEHINHIVDAIGRWTATHTVDELIETGQLMRFPWAKVASLATVLEDTSLTGQDYFSEIDVGGKTVRLPGLPWHDEGTRG